MSEESYWRAKYIEERRKRDLEMSAAANLQTRLRRMVGIALRYRRERDKQAERAGKWKSMALCTASGLVLIDKLPATRLTIFAESDMEARNG